MVPSVWVVDITLAELGLGISGLGAPIRTVIRVLQT